MVYKQKYKYLRNSLKVQPWTKADFDKNGLTDILVIGGIYGDNFLICILDKKDKYEIKLIRKRRFHDYTFPVVENDKIKYYFESVLERENWDKSRKLQKTILIYKFDSFIEENQTPANHKIEKNEYSTSVCFGTCPVFSITINSDKTAKIKSYGSFFCLFWQNTYTNQTQ